MLAISSKNPNDQELPLHNLNSLKQNIPSTRTVSSFPTPETDNTIQIPQPQFSISSQAFSMFLTRSIEKIASERETRKSNNSAVKKACEEALVLLKEQPLVLPSSKILSTNESSTHLPPLKSDCGILLSDERLLRPFQLACTMKSPKIVSTAVDSLQKLIAYGHIPNTAVCSSGKVRIIEQVVTTICSCFQVSPKIHNLYYQHSLFSDLNYYQYYVKLISNQQLVLFSSLPEIVYIFLSIILDVKYVYLTEYMVRMDIYSLCIPDYLQQKALYEI